MSKQKSWTNKNSIENLEHLNFMETQHICALCGSEVHIQVLELDSETLSLTEQASCNHCNIRTRLKTHTIQ